MAFGRRRSGSFFDDIEDASETTPANADHGLHRPAEPVEAKGLVLGNVYTDVLTGIKGVADGLYTFLTGCDQVSLKYMKEGEPKHIVVDASQILELRKQRQSVRHQEPVTARPGGPARVSPPGSRANL